jgi:hypothetical protein
MNTKHTPGPWAVDEKNGTTVKSGILFVADCDGMGDVTRQETSRANARLVASAPELLQALKACAFIVESIAHMQGREADLLPIADAARAAISKATGEADSTGHDLDRCNESLAKIRREAA